MNITEQFSVKKHLLQKASLSKTPLSGTFELTPRCNMNCKMCYIHMTEGEMKPFGMERTAEEWIDFGRECAKHGMLFLLLTGGEPFLRPDFHKIYSGLKRLGLCISINTNGTLLTDDDIQLLAKEKPEIVNITLYGANSETYRRLCNYESGFERAVNTIDKLKENGVPVQLNVTLTKENLPDLEKIIQFGKSRNIPLKITSYIFNPVRKTDGTKPIDSIVFSPEESGTARFLTMKYLLEPKLFETIRSQIRAGDFSIGIHGDDCDILQGSNMSCMAGRSAFWVTWDGRMLPCGMMNRPFAKPFEVGFANAWKTITDEIEKVVLPVQCSTCKAKTLCRPCGAIVQSERGNFSEKPEYLCASTKEYINLMRSDRN